MSAAAAAAAVAAARSREEELETPYMPQDVADDWEFKILRSGTGAFRKRATLEAALREEAEAGWVLLEKLDDSRLRFKRPRSARELDARATIDPYRSQYGLHQGALAMLILAVCFGIVLVVVTIANLTR